MIDIRQTSEYADYLRREGWIVERVEEINYFIKKFPMVGSFLKVQRPEIIDFEVIDKLCRKYRIFQVIVEPKTDKDIKVLASNGFKVSKSPYLPTKTLQIDLTKSQKQILASFKKDTRRVVKRGETNLIKSYSSIKDIKKWHKAWKNSVKLSRYVPSLNQILNLRKSFPGNKSLLLASHNIFGRIIGGALFTTSLHDRSNCITYYWYGFTNNEGRTSLSQAPLLYQAILWAKKQGYKIFDFEGIYDERFPNKSWLGFTHFKRSFGGTEVLYPGSFTKFRLPL
ncbi:MAG TPA: hypothetical protein VKC53_00845 [Patescibacteria group bacterium]|nr:hypothetical protein [Patescibacteria group bacterium]